MIFPNYQYKEFNNSNQNKWPIQPPSIESWCIMLKESKEYCKSLNDIFEFEGLCVSSTLPSEHPYWKIQSFKRTLDLIDSTRGFITQTQKFIRFNPNHSKIVNAKATIEKQKEDIIFYCTLLNLK